MLPLMLIYEILIEMRAVSVENIFLSYQAEQYRCYRIQSVQEKQSDEQIISGFSYKPDYQKRKNERHAYTTDIPGKAFSLIPKIEEIEYHRTDQQAHEQSFTRESIMETISVK